MDRGTSRSLVEEVGQFLCHAVAGAETIEVIRLTSFYNLNLKIGIPRIINNDLKLYFRKFPSRFFANDVWLNPTSFRVARSSQRQVPRITARRN